MSKPTIKRSHLHGRYWSRATQDKIRGLWVSGETREQADENAVEDLRRAQWTSRS